ncbi:MAG: ATP-binding cassette domain-containing protein [Lachnospiraceae bacterium]|nr:ATP-binding cassette domain-containing protein [Lachnospiraceae bacterium]
MEIEFDNVYKCIAGKPILKDINYKFFGGKIYGLRGKNGCGKTMLMRSIAGLMKPTNGRILINKKELYKDIEIPDSIGVLIENPAFLPEYSGFKNLKYLADIKNQITEEEIRCVLNKVGLDSNDKRIVRKYSLGMKQKLGIAAAIMEKPSIVLLDEPINALDESGVEKVKKCIMDLKEDNRIIIVACHDRDELNYLSDTIILMSEGKIIGEE